MADSPVTFWAKRVSDLALRCRLARRAAEYASSCGNGHETSDLLNAAAALYRDSLSVDAAARRRLVATAELYMNLAADHKRGGMRLRTFVPMFDRLTGGIAPGEVLTIIARPQVGKSALASQILIDTARSNTAAVFYSLEMPREQALERMTMQALSLDRYQVERLARADWSGLTHSQTAQLAPVRECVVIVDRGRSGLDELESGLQEAEVVLGRVPRLVVIDYLGLVSTGARNLPLYQRVSEAALEIKSLAKRHQAAVVLLAQAGRDQDPDRSEGAARLGMDAARDSGQVEEAADYLLTLWRPGLSSRLDANVRQERLGELDMALVKNRRGGLADWTCRMDPRTLTITSEAEP